MLGNNMAAQRAAALVWCSPQLSMAGPQPLPARLPVPVSAVLAVAVPWLLCDTRAGELLRLTYTLFILTLIS